MFLFLTSFLLNTCIHSILLSFFPLLSPSFSFPPVHLSYVSPSYFFSSLPSFKILAFSLFFLPSSNSFVFLHFLPPPMHLLLRFSFVLFLTFFLLNICVQPFFPSFFLLLLFFPSLFFLCLYISSIFNSFLPFFFSITITQPFIYSSPLSVLRSFPPSLPPSFASHFKVTSPSPLPLTSLLNTIIQRSLLLLPPPFPLFKFLPPSAFFLTSFLSKHYHSIFLS